MGKYRVEVEISLRKWNSSEKISEHVRKKVQFYLIYSLRVTTPIARIDLARTKQRVFKNVCSFKYLELEYRSESQSEYINSRN